MGFRKPVITEVSQDGEIFLPKAIREIRHWPAGTRLAVENTPEGVLLNAVPLFPETDIDAVFGCLRTSGGALSVAEMDAAIAREAQRRARD